MKKKAVIVDDNASNLMLEKDLLEVAGFEVFEAANGADGIAVILREKPDIIIMDIRLPDMLGTDAVKTLRKNNEVCDIPVIFVTALVMAGVKAEVAAVPNSLYMSKPIDTRTFASEISQFIK
ncbi:MAG: response regulator [Halothiobacillus sp.]|jgi:two-component system cell cycle response regulator DivK|nr:response regulator [Halothiobacillus sp.]